MLLSCHLPTKHVAGPYIQSNACTLQCHCRALLLDAALTAPPHPCASSLPLTLQLVLSLFWGSTLAEVSYQAGVPLLACAALAALVWVRGTMSVEQPQLCSDKVRVWE